MSVGLLHGGLGNIVGSLVIVALGIVVLLPRPRQRAQRSFAIFAIGIGLGTGASNLVFTDPAWPTELMWGLLGAGHAVALFALVGFVGATTGRPHGRDAWLLAVCFVVVAAVLTSGYLQPERLDAGMRILNFPDNRTIVPATFVASIFFAASWAAAMMLARWASGKTTAEQGQAVLLSSALVTYPAVIGTMGVRAELPLWSGLAWGTMLGAALVALAWLWTARRSASTRTVVVAALVPLLLVCAGMLLNASTAPWAPGASRIVMTALVAFAILRYHALGIDAKLRFGISKGSVAGVLVAVVFLVSEGAQSLFGADKQWLGLVAGALVVFAIAPLQRAADRLAEAAVPRDQPAREAIAGAEARYRAVAARYLRDGVLSPDEEATLAHLASDLGISAGRSFELRQEALREGRPR